MAVFRRLGALGLTMGLFSTLAGCGSKPPSTSAAPSASSAPVDPADSPIALVRRLATTAAKPIPTRPILPPEGPGYRYDSKAWCPDSTKGDAVREASAQFRALCERRGGTMDDFSFCVARDKSTEVLFMGKVTWLMGQACLQAVEASVLEPRASFTDPGYQRMLRIQGFVPVNERIVKRALDDWQRRDDAESEARRMASERARLEREWPTMRIRGTQVCKEYQGTTWMAFVEDESAGKLKLSIHRGFRTQAPAVSVTPSPPVLWEEAIYWRLC